MKIDGTLQALADPTRRRGVELLRMGPRAAGELAAELKMSAPAMSRHLKTLLRSGILSDERVRDDARLRVYKLEPARFRELSEWLDRIEAFLHAQSRERKRTLLIIDEAQNLSISALEELRMLSNFQYGGQALVQIFLLGQPEFRAALESDRLEQLRQRVIATHHLTAMGEDEIAPYITHRLTRAGWKGNPSFTADAHNALYRFSGGVPRRINLLANRALLYGALEQLDVIGAAAIEAVIDDMAVEEFASQPSPHSPDQPAAGDPTVALRLAALEARVEEQERALRRMLTLLVDWIEGEEDRPQGFDFRQHVG
jgi:type II secretory pathway predicted ATPase ExeA